MGFTLSIDSSGFAQAARRLMRAKKITEEKLVTDQARLLVRDCIRITPPFGSNSLTESFNVQRKVGENATGRDVLRTMKPIDSLDAVKNPTSRLGARLKQAAQRRDVPKATALLTVLLGREVTVIARPDRQVHIRMRGRRGRVPHNAPKAIVLDSMELRRYVKEEQSHVGRSKAGWIQAADALAVKGIPNWIRRHAGVYGGFISYDRTDGFFITVANRTPHARDFQELHIVKTALALRVRAMKLQAERIFGAELQKAMK